MSDAKQARDRKKKILNQENRITTLEKLLVYYKEITETVREPLLILDQNLYVVTANPAFYHTFKVLKKDTEHRLVYDLGNSQWDGPELRELLEHILPKHKILRNYEVTHDFPDLGRKVMLLNARQIDSKQLILLAIEDVTTQRQLTADSNETTANLVKQRDQLQGLNTAKDEFISLASHQLRTPATEIKQYVSMLTQGYAGKLSKDQMSMLNVVFESNERQLEIIEDLLRVAKVDDGKVYIEKSSYDVMKQVQAVVESQAVLFEKRSQSVVLVKPRKKIVAFIDQKLMRMVVENLLDNAGKYSPQGGKITVAVQQNATDTIISITDTGVGIRKSDYRKLFKKFSRIDNQLSASVKGTGLGLYWVKKIIDLHEGSIAVISSLHRGSTFVVKIPVSATR